MTDEEFLFRQTEIERKRLGYGDRHKKRGGGRSVRLPSDYMTKKQRERMNGEMIVYEMAKPHKLEELRTWPEWAKKEYLSGLIEKYHPTTDMLAYMMDTSRTTVSAWLKKLGVSLGRKGNTKETPEPDRAGWIEFAGAKPEEVSVVQKEFPAETDTILQLLQALAGTGAKLTIEVTL